VTYSIDVCKLGVHRVGRPYQWIVRRQDGSVVGSGQAADKLTATKVAEAVKRLLETP
jgi:hypothetical protein